MKWPRKDQVWVVVTLAILVCTALCAFEWIVNPTQVQEWLAHTGPFAPLVFIAVFSLATAAGLPRMVMYPVSGLLFGFWLGLLWSLLATLGGAYLAFCYARWAGSDWVLSKWPKANLLARQLQGRSALKVAILRQLPAPGFLSNIVFGISQVSHMDFLIGSAVGFLPAAVPANLLGASVQLEHPTLRYAGIIGAAALILILWSVSPLMIGRAKSTAAPDSSPACNYRS